jgi:beta-N-acetylhexosaminidase
VDLDRKIGQLFVVAAPRPDLIHHVRGHHAGGVIWFQSTTAEAARTNAQLQSLAETPLLISADLEAGLGMRFTDAEWALPAMALAATGDPAFAEEQARQTAREAKAIGINHIFAPVADVNVDPQNPVINTRSFGEDPHDVARYVAAFVRGLESEGVLATAKHFPGHGDTRVDSHRSLPLLDVTAERLHQVELVPFRAAIAAGVSSVMIGHLGLPCIDPIPVPVRAAFENMYGTTAGEVPRHAVMPATLSAPVISLLRETLGFDGLVITDAMDMGGLAAHFDPGEAAVRAIEAGEDQVLFSPDTGAAIAAVKAAVHTGRLSEARIDQSVARILRAKARVGGSHTSYPSHRDYESDRTNGTDRTNRTCSAAAEHAIALVRDTHGLLPLRGKALAVRAFTEDPLDDALAGLSGACAIGAADVIVLLIAARPRSGAGSIAVADEAKRIAHANPEKTVVVSFGSPYILRELGGVSTFVCAWGPQPVLQRAAVRAVMGEIEFRGRVPVTVSR